MQRKGMSPLIATVLLMAFAVALGGMIMNWSIDRQKSGQCDDVKLTVNKFCSRGGQIILNLRNEDKSVEIQRIQINVIDSIEKTLHVRDTKMAPGDIIGDLAIREEVGLDTEVQIIAVVGKESSPVVCSKPIQTQTSLPKCET